jgi:hypothetical protein
MSSPAVQIRSASASRRSAGRAGPRSPSSRGAAPRRPVPFVTLVVLVLLGGVIGLLMFNTSMQQASFAATALEQQAAPSAPRADPAHGARRAPRPAARRRAAQRMGMVSRAARRSCACPTARCSARRRRAPARRLRLLPGPREACRPRPAAAHRRTAGRPRRAGGTRRARGR